MSEVIKAQINENEAYRDLIDRARNYVQENLIVDNPEMDHTPEGYFSTQQYMLRVLNQGIQAAEDGTYGIGAGLAFRYQGVEVIYYGRNGLLSNQNPRDHAESKALDLSAEVAQLDDDEERDAWIVDKLEKGLIEIRRYDKEGSDPESVDLALYTTLEPCHKCTVEILTANINNQDKISKVYIGAPDVLAGGMVEDRYLNKLYQEQENLDFTVWGHLSSEQSLTPILCQSNNDQSTETYVDPELLKLTDEIFTMTREVIDDHLGDEGVLNKEAMRAINLVALNYISTVK